MSSASGPETRSRRKRKLTQDAAPLQLVLETPSTPAKKPCLGQHPRLHLDAENCVAGSVNGRACKVLLDTGGNFAIVHWSAARRLGLITGAEDTTPMKMYLWSGAHTLHVVSLEAVTVSLGAGVEVLTPVEVFPAWVESLYRPVDVVLPVQHLRRGRAVQVFRPGGSDLYVRSPGVLLRKVRRTAQMAALNVIRVKEPRGGEATPMTMMVDTGAKNVYVYDKRLEMLTRGRGGRRLPQGVSLDIGGGCCLYATPLERCSSDQFDFILGLEPLGKYHAVLDYPRHSLTLRLGSQWRTVRMQTSH